MKEFLLTNRPKISLYLTLILLVTNIITLVFSQIGNFIMLFPSNLKEPWNWYRLITYPLYVGGLKAWFLNSLALILYGYIIENRIKKYDLLRLIFISSISGGLFFMIFNQNNEINIPMASPTMISWGYWAATIIIGLRFWKTLNLFEKIIMVFGFLSILSFWNDNLGFLLGQLIVVILIMTLTIFKIKNKNWA